MRTHARKFVSQLYVLEINLYIPCAECTFGHPAHEVFQGGKNTRARRQGGSQLKTSTSTGRSQPCQFLNSRRRWRFLPSSFLNSANLKIKQQSAVSDFSEHGLEKFRSGSKTATIQSWFLLIANFNWNTGSVCENRVGTRCDFNSRKLRWFSSLDAGTWRISLFSVRHWSHIPVIYLSHLVARIISWPTAVHPQKKTKEEMGTLSRVFALSDLPSWKWLPCFL